MRSGGDETYLEKVVDHEAMLTSKEAETSPKEEPANEMRYGGHRSGIDIPSDPCLFNS